MSLICLSIAESTPEKMLQVFEEQRPYYDMVEIRADALYEKGLESLASLQPILEQSEVDILWTVRWCGEGGPFPDDEDERTEWLEYGDKHGANWIDIEAKSPLAKNYSPKKAKCIHSFHNFDVCPENLHEIAKEMDQLPNQMIKLAVASSSTADLRKCIELYRLNLSKPLIAIAMGEWGESSRILPALLGMPWTYASADDKPTAPGQFSAKELREVYNFSKVSEDTRVNVVIGDPVSHSLSPAMHNRLYRRLKTDAVYGRIHVDDMSEFYKICEVLKIKGVSVTVPHKEALMTHLDEDAPLKKIAAANTLSRVNNEWQVFNTDIEAAMDALKTKLKTGTIPKVLLLGAGGVSRALGWGVVMEGWNLTVTNRSIERAKKLSAELNCQILPWEERNIEAYDILINGTSLGMSPNDEVTPIELNSNLSHKVVFDTVYTPEQTVLLKQAAKCGAQTVTGREMFYRQGALQHQHWFGGEVPYEAMQEIVKSLN